MENQGGKLNALQYLANITMSQEVVVETSGLPGCRRRLPTSAAARSASGSSRKLGIRCEQSLPYPTLCALARPPHRQPLRFLRLIVVSLQVSSSGIEKNQSRDSFRMHSGVKDCDLAVSRVATMAARCDWEASSTAPISSVNTLPTWNGPSGAGPDAPDPSDQG